MNTQSPQQPHEILQKLLQDAAHYTQSSPSYSLKRSSLPRIDSKNVRRYFYEGLFCKVQSRHSFQQMVPCVFMLLKHGTGMIFFIKVLEDVCVEELHFEALYSVLLDNALEKFFSEMHDQTEALSEEKVSRKSE